MNRLRVVTGFTAPAVQVTVTPRFVSAMMYLTGNLVPTPKTTAPQSAQTVSGSDVVGKLMLSCWQLFTDRLAIQPNFKLARSHRVTCSLFQPEYPIAVCLSCRKRSVCTDNIAANATSQIVKLVETHRLALSKIVVTVKSLCQYAGQLAEDRAIVPNRQPFLPNSLRGCVDCRLTADCCRLASDFSRCNFCSLADSKPAADQDFPFAVGNLES